MPDQKRRVFGLLLFHPRIGLSWLCFAVVGLFTAFILISFNVPPPAPVMRPPAATTTMSAQTTTVAPPSSSRKHRRKSSKPVVQEQPQPRVASATPAAPPQPQWTPRSNANIFWASFEFGYFAWSLYWGIPAVLWLMWVLVNKAFTSWSSALATWASFLIGFWPALAVGLAMIVGGIAYSILGGGIGHFIYYWWRLCNPRPEPAAVQPRPQTAPPVHQQAPGALAPAMMPIAKTADEPEQRLRKMTDLLQNGLISQEEYAAARAKIIEELASGFRG